MRWLPLVALAACGDPGLDPFPGGTEVTTNPQQIFEIVGDGDTIVWLTLGLSNAPATLWRMGHDDVPRLLYTASPGVQPGGLVLVNHQPYFEIFVGEAFPQILTLNGDTVVQIGDGTQSLAGGDGAFLARSRNGVVTVADPRTGSERDPWELTFTSDNGTYVYGNGKIVHSLYPNSSGETIELGTGKRETFTYPHHTPLALIPADDGYFFDESSIGLFHATSRGTTQLTRDPGFGSYVALGDDLWFAITTTGELQPTTTALGRIRPDGSAELRELQTDTALVFRNGGQLMAVTRGMLGIDNSSTIWRVDTGD